MPVRGPPVSSRRRTAGPTATGLAPRPAASAGAHPEASIPRPPATSSFPLPPPYSLVPPGRWQRLQRRGSGWGAAAPPLPRLGRASNPPQPPPAAPSPRWRLRSMSACRREALPCEGSAVVTPTFARSSPRVLKIGTVANYNRLLKTVSRHPRKNE